MKVTVQVSGGPVEQESQTLAYRTLVRQVTVHMAQ